ncbi:MAG: hypothetical protein RJA98_3553 [Pseudomonadota bacterium]|jgi:HlyD family secretion protein
MTTPQSTEELTTLLAPQTARPLWKRGAVWAGVAALVLAAGGWLLWQNKQAAAAEPRYVTEAVTRGKLALTVSANGTLQPTRSVNIGSELSGTVAQVTVDVNDVVKKGQVLVLLDPAKLNDQISRSRATLASASAKLLQVQATVKEATATLARFEEVARLSGGKVPSATELDTARATLARARADEAAAKASVDDARAAARTDETNLGKAAIRSPIDGVVLTRTVEPGNAVAASLQAVTLLTLAEDLSKLKLAVNVDEADVGSVQVGQGADFSVSAHASRRYPATITRVAFGSTISDNVVTYTTTLAVDNADQSLRPGMTASANIRAVERNNVLKVPNAALRFTPASTAAKAASGGASASSTSILSKLMPRPPGGTGTRTRAAGGAAGTAKVQQVYVLRDGQAVSVPVTVGISDGRYTEVSGTGLDVGMAVITDQQSGVAK